MATPTKTTNRIHFSDIEPSYFEHLGYALLQNEFTWSHLDHTGALGNDGGVDILGLTENNITYYIQVKRYKSLNVSQISEILNKIVAHNDIDSNSGVILFVGCDLGANAIKEFYRISKELGFCIAKLYTATTIEALLYNKYHSLLEQYFGIKIGVRRSASATIKKSIAKKKLANKLLLRTDIYNKYPAETIEANPEIIFVTDEFILLSAQSLLLPERYGESSSFIKAWPIRFLDEGILFKVPLYQPIAFNIKSKKWRKLGIGDTTEPNEYILQYCQVVWLLPYYHIQEIEADGDSTFNNPIIICDNNPIDTNVIKETALFHGIVFDETIPLTSHEEDIITAHILTNIAPKKVNPS